MTAQPRIGPWHSRLLAAAGLLLAGPTASLANEFDAFDDVDRVGSYEVWTGVDAASRTWLAYTGVTVSPLSDTHADGLRLRATSGVGQYRYEYSRDQSGRRVEVAVDKAAADILVGYQAGFDNLTVKAFAGWAVLSRDFAISSLGERFSKLDHGFKLATELWFDWSEVNWISLDASYADTRATIDTRLRMAQRLENNVSAGGEAIFNHSNLSGEVLEAAGRKSLGNLRFGAFVRYDWFGGEASLSAGLSTDVVSDAAVGVDVSKQISPYGALTVLFQF